MNETFVRSPGEKREIVFTLIWSSQFSWWGQKSLKKS